MTHPKPTWLGPCFPLHWEAARNIKGIISRKGGGEINGSHKIHLRSRNKVQTEAEGLEDRKKIQ